MKSESMHRISISVEHHFQMNPEELWKDDSTAEIRNALMIDSQTTMKSSKCKGKEK